MDAQIGRIARSLGASTASVVPASLLRKAPSHRASGSPKLDRKTKAVLVFGLHHSREEPSLDWWGGDGHTPGNRKMERIAEALISRLAEEFQVRAQLLPYHPSRGGVFLKDAAVLGGLGVIGRNNLVITPEFGPRVRWRALGLDRSVNSASTEIRFDPCAGCGMPCRSSCPQGAFAPGAYSKEACMKQMRKDESEGIAAGAGQMWTDSAARLVKYCRACELACPSIVQSTRISAHCSAT